MSLWMVTSSIPENPLELTKLKEDLRQMRCTRLLERPWTLKREEIVRKLLQPECLNIFDGTIRDRPQLWTAEQWREVYEFPSGGAGLANWMDGYIKGRFMHQVDPKDGYAVGDCRNARQRRVLEFIVPIFHPDKPTRVTITLGNTIFGALDRGREVDWGLVFRDLAQRLAKGVGKLKSTPICPFIFHLYDSQGLLTEDEELDYRMAKEMAGYRITPEPDSRLGSDDEGQAPTLAALPVWEVPMHTPNRRMKTTYRAPEGSLPVGLGGPTSPVQLEQCLQAQPEQRPLPQPEDQLELAQPNEEEEPEWVSRPFAVVTASLRQAKRQYLGMEEALEEISAELGVEPRQVLEHIKALPKAWEMEDLRARIDYLLKENAELKTQVTDWDEKLKEAEALTAIAFKEKVQAQEEHKKAVTMAWKFHAFVGFSGNVVTKARLYDDYMKKPEVVPAPKVLRIPMDYSGKVEKLFGELRTPLARRAGCKAEKLSQTQVPIPL